MGIISLLFCLWRSGRHFLLQFHPPQQGGSSNGCHVPEVWLPPLIGRGNPTHPPSKPSLQEAFVNCTLHQVSPVAAPRCPQRLEASYGKKLFCGRPRAACPPASTSPPQHPGWGRPFVARAGASEGSSQSRRELRAPAVEFPPFSLRAVPACCWCRGARGQGHEPCVGDWGTLHREEGGHSSL